MASLTTRCRAVRELLVALLLAAVGLNAHTQEVPAAQVLEALATEAFQLYAQEAAQSDRDRRDELMSQRTSAFYVLSKRFASFIATTFPDESRESPAFALALFTYALYLELSADIWHARDRYAQVCELIKQKLVPTGQAVPVYNKVSILSLCGRQIDRLSAAIRIAGRRPTKVSILQSVNEPDSADFLDALRPHLRQEDLEVLKVVRAPDQATKALQEAIERLGGEPENAAAWVPQVLGELARQRAVPFQVARNDRVAIVGLGLTGQVFEEQVAAIRTVTGAYQRTIANDVLELAPPVFVMRGPIVDTDAAFLTSAISGYQPIDPKYKYESRGALPALVGPQIPSHDSEDYAAVDQVVVWSHALHQHLPSWLSLAFLDYDGTGAYSMKYFAWIFDGLREARGMVTPVPSYECARSRSASRFCLMHAGAFARFLDSVRSASSPERTLLQLYAVRLGSAGNLTASGKLALLEEVSGQSVEDLGRTFLGYVQSAPSLNSFWLSREARELARVLEQDFRASSK